MSAPFRLAEVNADLNSFGLKASITRTHEQRLMLTVRGAFDAKDFPERVKIFCESKKTKRGNMGKFPSIIDERNQEVANR